MSNIKRTQILASTTLALGLFAFVLTIGDILALHDISNDYVSKRILDYLEITPSKELPAWTMTTGEWAIVKLSLVSRMVFFILNAVTLVLCVRGLKRGGGLSA